ncbi:MAG TPA: metal ABC transporter permease [Conexibacter sp.]|nr:metal ABC transporter permease [Conexibacter sp.]
MNANPSPSWDPVRDVRELLAFPFMVHALEAATIVAVLAGVVGWYMVLRRESFAGHTLSMMAFPGAAGAALAGLPAALGYYVACAAGALAIGGTRRRETRSGGGESATIGAVQAAGLAAGFLFLSLDRSVLSGLEDVLFGTIVGITRAQVVTLLIVAAVAVAAVVFAARPLLFATLDPAGAQARGVPVRALDVGFMLLLGLAVAATSQITGVLLVFALLVAPAATAQTLTARPGLGLALSVAIALAVAWVGLGLAYFSIYPVGFFTTSLAFAAYVAARLARAGLDRRARRA